MSNKQDKMIEANNELAGSIKNLVFKNLVFGFMKTVPIPLPITHSVALLISLLLIALLTSCGAGGVANDYIDQNTQDVATTTATTNYVSSCNNNIIPYATGSYNTNNVNQASTLKADWSKVTNTATLHGHSRGVSAIAFTPDSTKLASGDYQGSIRFWDMNNLSDITYSVADTASDIFRHSQLILSLAFSADGKKLASGSFDRKTTIWDMCNASGPKSIYPIYRDSPTMAIFHKEKGGLFDISSYYMKVTDVSDLSTPRHIASRDLMSVWKNPNGSFGYMLHAFTGLVYNQKRNIAVSIFRWNENLDYLKLWNVPNWRNPTRFNGAITPKLPSPKTQATIAISPDGTKLAYGNVDHRYVRVYSLANLGAPRLIYTLDIIDKSSFDDGVPAKVFNVNSIAFSPDSTKLATSSVSIIKNIKIWDISSSKAKLINTFDVKDGGHEAGSVKLAFSPDGTKLASGDSSGIIKIWEPMYE